jgi:hypothetical protein
MSSDEAKTLALLGLTKAELQERVVARLCADVTTVTRYDEDGDECVVESSLRRDLTKAVREAIDVKVSAIAEEHVLPKVGALIENVTLQSTNEWGEKKGETKTFVEYLTERAEAYLREKVNYEGKVSRDSYSRDAQTRIVYLVNKYLKYEIETAMKGAVKTVNQALIEGVTETVKLQCADIAKKLELKVVKTR